MDGKKQSAFEREFVWYLERDLDIFTHRREAQNSQASLIIADESNLRGTLERYSFSFLIDNIYARWGLKPSEAYMESILNLRENIEQAVGKALRNWRDRFSGIQNMACGVYSIDIDSADPMISVGLAYVAISEPGKGRFPLPYKVRPITEVLTEVKPVLQKSKLYGGAPYCVLIDYKELSGELSKRLAFEKDVIVTTSEIPVCPTSRLEAELDEAARTERFEEAAILRDKIRAIKEDKKK